MIGGSDRPVWQYQPMEATRNSNHDAGGIMTSSDAGVH